MVLAGFFAPGLRPALGRVLPGLLASVAGHVQQSVGGGHDVDTATTGVVGLEHPLAAADVADQVVNLPVTTLQELCRSLLGRVSRHVQTHEVAVSDALLIRAFTTLSSYGPLQRVAYVMSREWR
jgi:hypothetical protein